MNRSSQVLTINAGSSSIRFAVFEPGLPPKRTLVGKVDRIGLANARMEVTRGSGKTAVSRLGRVSGHRAAVARLLKWLEGQGILPAVGAVGHRVVHGMNHAKPAKITARLLGELRANTPYDPDHLPVEIELIAAIRGMHPGLPQVACFDTTFHREMPRLATLLPIPWSYSSKGVRRYGFHGLSYQFLVGELLKLGDPAVRGGRVILAHLGNGSSLAAVLRGKCVDTSMGFTPAAGLVMGTRSGDLDPGLLAFLSRSERMSAVQFEEMINHSSGLLGISGRTSDMRDLMERGPRDRRAADAVGLFCYQAKKWMGSYAAALGGVDTVVFSGGIGENAPEIRARICRGLEFLGLRLDAARNARNDPVISARASGVVVRVIRTDEELVIAKAAVASLRIRG
jgi:acetate kinase